MGWLSKIFKGSRHNISERNYRGNYGQDSNFYAPSTSGVFTNSASLMFLDKSYMSYKSVDKA